MIMPDYMKMFQITPITITITIKILLLQLDVMYGIFGHTCGRFGHTCGIFGHTYGIFTDFNVKPAQSAIERAAALVLSMRYDV